MSTTIRRVRTLAPIVRTFAPFANCEQWERLVPVQRMRVASVCGKSKNYEWRAIGWLAA
jgi:hypothetical protein